MEHWIDDVLPAAIREVSAHAGGRPVHLVGWSLGGLFALLTAADRSALPIASVTALGVARRRQARAAGRSAAAAAQPGPGPRAGDARLPGAWAACRSRWSAGPSSSPRCRSWSTKPLAIGLNLDDTEFLAQLEAVDRFSAGMMAYPGRTFGQLYHRFVKANVLVDGSIDLGRRSADHLAGGRRGPGARLRRRDGRDRPAAVGAGRDAAPDGLARRPLRDRARRSPRDAHRPRGADVDLAGARRVGGRVVRRGRDPRRGSHASAPREGTPAKKAPREGRPREPARRSAPTRSAATARPAPAPCRAELAERAPLDCPGARDRHPEPRSVRIGYGSGSVATGAFGTVPGLMLLPFLTDSLGIAALWAGLHRVPAEGLGRACSTRSRAASPTGPSTRAGPGGPGCCAPGCCWRSRSP